MVLGSPAAYTQHQPHLSIHTARISPQHASAHCMLPYMRRSPAGHTQQEVLAYKAMQHLCPGSVRICIHPFFPLAFLSIQLLRANAPRRLPPASRLRPSRVELLVQHAHVSVDNGHGPEISMCMGEHSAGQFKPLEVVSQTSAWLHCCQVHKS